MSQHRWVIGLLLVALVYGCKPSQEDPLPAIPAEIGSKGSADGIDAELCQATAMWRPYLDYTKERRDAYDSFLDLQIQLTSEATNSKVVRLKKCWFSHDANFLGREVTVCLYSRGKPTNDLSTPLRHEDRKTLEIRGQGIFPVESVDKYAWVAVEILVDDVPLWIRRSTLVGRKGL